MAITLIAFTALLLLVMWLRRVVKQAAVEPVINGKFPVKVFSEKRRYEVLWDDWKFSIALALGFGLGWWLCGALWH